VIGYALQFGWGELPASAVVGTSRSIDDRLSLVIA
jgi:hypothetical protein